MRHFNWTSPSVFTGADDFGVFRFRPSLTGGTGNALADFLLGIPASADQTQVGPDIDGSSNNYGFFVQDEWRVSRSVTVNLGMRYDLNKPFKDAELNITNFLRDTPNGDVVVPNEGLAAAGQARLHVRAGQLAHPHRRRSGSARVAAQHRRATTSRPASASPGGPSTTTGPCSGSATASSPAASWAPSSTR